MIFTGLFWTGTSNEFIPDSTSIASSIKYIMLSSPHLFLLRSLRPNPHSRGMSKEEVYWVKELKSRGKVYSRPVV
ncbi:hypothetical protein P8452_31405 [Trifolium repens]|nr:hypothetical protein P8452_31405 [Trifolium repens]